jgi:hypothetical protein
MNGRRVRRVAAAGVVLVLCHACGGVRADGPERWRPDAETTWQWQLQGTINTAYAVDAYDVDLIDTPGSVLDELRADGRRIVCYFSAGTWETFRDEGDLPDAAIGRPLVDFRDERWLDIRHEAVRDRVVDRLELAQQRGCDGVEPDNVDGFANDTGFDLSADDQREFNRFLARAAHERGLAVGLKNDLDQVAELVDEFDFAVNEQCHEFDECEALLPFVSVDKPVFNAEYRDSFRLTPQRICEASARLGLRTLVLPVELDDSFRVSCDG